MGKVWRDLTKALSSLQLTIACLLLLMVLVGLCTLDQVNLGTYQSVQKYFRSFFLYWRAPGSGLRLPVFPAGGLVGGALLVNLVASHLTRFQPAWRKSGIWLIHSGLILLVLGEFVTGALSVETQMAIEEGSTANYSESLTDCELVVIDSSPKDYDQVVSVPQELLKPGQTIEHPLLPFKLRVLAFHPNATLARRPPGAPPSLATAGIGPGIVFEPLPRVTADDERDQPTALVNVLDGDRSLGVYLLSAALGAPQAVISGGRLFTLAIRPTRHYLPYQLTLKKFRHDVYPGTTIPRNFSSLLRLRDPQRREDRDVLVYMNNPLRYEGKTFYQASFGKNDTLSVLQVVENPGWRLPYVSCVLVALGLVLQFAMHLASFKPS